MQDDHKLLTPEASPSELRKGSGVRRVNNFPLYFIGGAVAIFLLVMLMVSFDRSNPRSSPAPQVTREKADDSTKMAQAVAGSQTGGFVPAAQSKLPELAAIPIAIPDNQSSANLDQPPMPPRLEPPRANLKASADPEAERIRKEKVQLFENALKSKTGVPISELSAQQGTLNGINSTTMTSHSASSQQMAAIESGDADSHFQARLSQFQGGGASYKFVKASDQTNDIRQFDTNGKSNRWALNSNVEAMPTPYTLRAGFVIPATMISGINSDLPGQIIAQVSQNVYDTASGQYVLVPQGTRLVGAYKSDIAYGQSRVLVAWQRMVFPDGRAMDIGAMPGADEAGYAGFSDQVDNHYLRIFGSAILMSGITAGVSLSQDQNANSIYSQPTTSSIISQSLGQQLGSVATEMIRKNLNISPTLEIRPGFRFNVMCVKDLVFNEPYTSMIGKN